jgi:polyferredoxin
VKEIKSKKRLNYKAITIWGIKLFFLIGYLLEFIIGEKSYYREFESLVILSILVLGTFYCNHLCPYGIISELFEKLGKLLFGKWRKKIQIPSQIDYKLRYLKYAFGLFFIWIFVSGTADFWGNRGEMYMSTTASKVYFIVKLTLGISLLSLFFDRFFCRYLCYQKAWYNVIELISPTKLERNPNTCSSCKLCDKKCPMNVPVSEKQTIKTYKDCISCYNCVIDCPPKFQAMKLTFFGIQIKPFVFIVWSAFLYFFLSWIWTIFKVENLMNNWL